jgi:diketogulonate reductase-like aldo/keto reductase
MENQVVRRIAADHNVTPAQVAIQWLVRQPAVITIPKSSDISHAKENMDALDLELVEEEVAALNAIAS